MRPYYSSSLESIMIPLLVKLMDPIISPDLGFFFLEVMFKVAGPSFEMIFVSPVFVNVISKFK